MIDKRGKAYQEFGAYLSEFVRDLNNSSEEGWCVLVEGMRDRKALRSLGYTGSLVSMSAVGRKGVGALAGSTKVILLTDLDREGTVIASKLVRRLGHEGVRMSLGERLRLKAASRGVFLHIENLGRFARPEESRWGRVASDATPRQDGPYRQGLKRFRRK